MENWKKQRLAAKVIDVVEIGAFLWLLHFAMNLAEFLDRIPEMAADATVEQVAELALISAAFNLLIIGFVMYYVSTRYLAPLMGLAVEVAVEAVKDAPRQEDGEYR